ncbi:MAG: hypothetical protein AAF333_09820 [Planctomycetota bacterium]
MLCMWVTHQGGLLPAEPASADGPGSARAFLGVLAIIVEALPTLAGWWGAAAGYGFALRQRGIAQVGVGMAFLQTLNYVLGLAVGFTGPAAWSMVGVGWGCLVFQVIRGVGTSRSAASTSTISAPPVRRAAWVWLIGVPGLALLLVGACCPPGTLWAVEAFGYDVTSYHLQIPKEWVAARGMVELEHNVYAYLPGLMEAAFTSLFTMYGGADAGGVYLCQLFHASFAVLAAIGVAHWLRGWVSPLAATAGGAVVLLVPWTIVTGASAYNEQVAVAFAVVGLSIVAGADKPCGRGAAAVGLLAGAATLAKLTAAFTVALPLGGVLVWRLLIDRSAKKALAPAALCVLVGSATLLPYLARNAAWTGNPVFPFAQSTLGESHWDEARAQRWNAAHMPDAPWGERLSSTWRQAIGNAGYGAIGGSPTPPESRNIARFRTESGVPVFWLAALGGLTYGLTQKRLRWLSGVALVVLLWQFVWWLTLTHLQSRFLIVGVVPLVAAVGLLLEALTRLPGRGGCTGPGLGAAVMGILLSAGALTVTWSQAVPLTLPGGRSIPAPLWFITDGLPSPYGRGTMPSPTLNGLPADARVMVVGNNQSLFYFERDLIYASAFDESPLTPILRQADTPDVVAAALRSRGVTHLWIGYSEIDRLHATYGFDAEVTAEGVARVVRGWNHLTPPGPSELVEVPAAPR